MTTAAEIITRAKELGIESKLWEKSGRTRIYAQTGRKDMSVYLECDGPSADISGAALKVFCNAEQHPNWIKSQVADFRARFIGLFHAYVFEHYAQTGPQPNGFGIDINAMIDDARAFVASRAAEDESDDQSSE